jgi:hypothetical protein
MCGSLAATVGALIVPIWQAFLKRQHVTGTFPLRCH